MAAGRPAWAEGHQYPFGEWANIVKGDVLKIVELMIATRDPKEFEFIQLMVQTWYISEIIRSVEEAWLVWHS